VVTLSAPCRVQAAAGRVGGRTAGPAAGLAFGCPWGGGSSWGTAAPSAPPRSRAWSISVGERSTVVGPRPRQGCEKPSDQLTPVKRALTAAWR
jgi:hypothetical protein